MANKNEYDGYISDVAGTPKYKKYSSTKNISANAETKLTLKQNTVTPIRIHFENTFTHVRTNLF